MRSIRTFLNICKFSQIFVFILTVSLLGYLVKKSFNFNLNQKHIDYQQKIFIQQKIKSSIFHNILFSYYNFEANEQIIQTLLLDLQKNEAQLEQPPINNKNYQKALAKNQNSNQKIVTVIKQYSYVSFRLKQEIEKLLSISEAELLSTVKDNTLADSSLISTFLQLRNNIILYYYASDENVLDTINELNQQLQTIEQSQSTDLEERLLITFLQEQTESILTVQDELTHLIELLADLTALGEDEKFIQSYQAAYQQQINQVAKYRLGAYICFFLIASCIAYKIIAHLSKANRNIIRVLEKFTQELETRVEERTAQLAESINEAELARMKAEEANLAKSRFLANMSHELRTPLNAILGFTQLIRKNKALGPEEQENIEIISRSGEHLLSLINDILEMSKIEAGQLILNVKQFDIYRLLDNIEEMLRLKAESKNLKLVFERDRHCPRYFNGDEGKLRQVLINLLGNALKFTETGSVFLRVDYQPQAASQLDLAQLHFEIEDTGPGIAPEEIDMLFTPFEQTETGRHAKEGTGLGLAISQKFVQLMGGEIQAYSQLGQGTIFHFNIYIEAVQNQQTEVIDRRVIGLALSVTRRRILVVDDFRESRILLNKMLTSIGFLVEEAADGQEAVEIWQEWQPDLIWMDMRMPVMDGMEATKRIKSQPKGKDTVIIALTASAFEEERTVILAAGCDDFVRKPFKEEVLLAKIAQHLGVRYIYQESEMAAAIDESNHLSLTTQALKVMPTEWLKQLHQAAAEVNNQAIFELIGQIPTEHTAMATSLSNLVHNFRCDKIIDLTEEIIK